MKDAIERAVDQLVEVDTALSEANLTPKEARRRADAIVAYLKTKVGVTSHQVYVGEYPDVQELRAITDYWGNDPDFRIRKTGVWFPQADPGDELLRWDEIRDFFISESPQILSDPGVLRLVGISET